MLPVTEEEYIPQKNESTVTYSTEETNIKYEYISMKNGVKENILLKEKPEKYSFKYKIEGENICLKQRKNDRGILVYDSSTNETIGYISPPNLEDGNGDVDYENVEYKLKKENSETEIEVKLNRQYFDNESLKYPVKVDPTMVWAIFIDTVARLGHKGGIIGGVGKDDFGKCLLDRLKSDGVDVSHVIENPKKATGCAIVTYFDDGSRKFIFHMGNTPAVEAKAPQKDVLDGVRYFHVMGCSLFADIEFAKEILKAAQTAKKIGAKVSFDPNIRKE